MYYIYVYHYTTILYHYIYIFYQKKSCDHHLIPITFSIYLLEKNRSHVLVNIYFFQFDTPPKP